MMPIYVNGNSIAPAAIDTEAQNHPADRYEVAQQMAAQALIVQELLLQEASRLNIVAEPTADDGGSLETESDALVRQLLQSQVSVPDADEASCLRYYEQNRQRFMGPNLYEPAHILFSASPDDENAYNEARAKAALAIQALVANPASFASLAKQESACSSKHEGGRLGQVSAGDTVPEFEAVLATMDEGSIYGSPVKTRYGVHVVRLDKRIAGNQLPFVAVKERIADYLQSASWHRAVAQFIKILVGKADIQGLQLDGADSMLVQ